ncbi:MAG: chitobiase/beta-hexosaminidase C-terminal domain-containing protein, partial [Lachnospiraceae bacterium]|nr:chitobiase/beta-hexosaminidase C-terminal domain-containing protein [Lachnospiraceae bacterium]
MPDEALFCESCGKERQLVPVFEAEINESMDEAISNIAVQLANTQEIKPQELARDQQIRQQIFEEKANAGELNKEGDSSKESVSRPSVDDEDQTGDSNDGGRNEGKDDQAGTRSDVKNSRDQKSDIRKPDKKRSGTQTEISRIAGIRLPFVLLLASLVVVLMLTGIMSYALRKNQTSTYEYQIRQAKMYEQQKDYEQMLIYARKATDIAANSSDAKMLVAKAYAGLGKTDEEKIVLEGLLITDPAFAEAYSALIPMYEADGEYEKIAQLLAGCPDQTIIGKYSGYLASPPEFSVQGGEYSEPVSLKLLASGAGTIYYTVNGSAPTPESPVYTMPILLDSGRIKVRAIYENNLGIISRESTAEYKIVIDETQVAETVQPEVLLDSGTYTNPQV